MAQQGAADRVPPAEPVHEPVAIVGLHGRLPGADDLATFWDNLVHGRSAIVPVPAERWDWQAWFGDPASGDRTWAKAGGFITDVDAFDARFFGIPEREARLMDPAQRLALESAWHCIEEAGYRLADLAATETGVFVATGKSDYEELLHRNGTPIDASTATGSATALVANRISFALGLTGPSLSIDTACSGSLAALHLAAQALWAGDCGAALVGAVNLMLTPSLTISLDKEGALSADGRTRSFDAEANGYARGEGVVFLLAKRLADAERDGDHIHGVLRGSAISHGGRANWLTAPNAGGQAALIEKAVRRAGIDPRTITYVEAHGTGTPLGDPIEFNALRQAFEALTVDRPAAGPAHRCTIGTVKANIGHLEAASGLAGVAKVLLAMRHGLLPGHPHLAAVNDLCRTEGTPFDIPRLAQPWTRVSDDAGRPAPCRAGVSAFGFGGAYAHAVIEEYVGTESGAEEDPEDAVLPVLPVSAKDKAALRRYATRLHAFAADQAAADAMRHLPVEDLLQTFQIGRAVMPARFAVIGASWPALAASLVRFLAGEEDPSVVTGENAGRTEEPERDRLEQLSLEFARRWVGRQPIDFAAFYAGRRPRRMAAPAYPFARSRYWFDRPSVPDTGADARATTVTAGGRTT